MIQNTPGPPLDPEMVESLYELTDEGDDSFVCDLYESFLQSYQGCLMGMKEALQEQDTHRFGREAHTLKGASSNVGATAMAQIALSLQMSGDGGDLTEARENLAQLEEEYQRVLEAIERDILKTQPQ